MGNKIKNTVGILGVGLIGYSGELISENGGYEKAIESGEKWGELFKDGNADPLLQDPVAIMAGAALAIGAVLLVLYGYLNHKQKKQEKEENAKNTLAQPPAPTLPTSAPTPEPVTQPTTPSPLRPS